MVPRRLVRALPIALVALVVLFATAVPALAAPGDLDSSISGDGRVRVGISGGAADVAMQPDGKAVAVGTGGGDFAIVRFNRDGTLDHSFSGDGVAHISSGSDRTDVARAVAIRNGKIVVVGSSVRNSDSVHGLAILRLNADGTPDTSFSDDGLQILRVGNSSDGADVAIQGDGKIVVAGTSDGEFLVVRRLSNGDPDHGFSGDGSDRTGFAQEAQGLAVGVDPTNGRILVGGRLFGSAGSHGLAVEAYTKSGALDTTFSGDGKMVRPTSAKGGLSRLAVLDDGRIVAAGTTGNQTQKGQFLVEKFNRAGDFDPSFGGGDGQVTVGFMSGGHARDDLAFDVGVQSDGRIVVAGHSLGADDEFAVARLNGNGTLDGSFHGGGVLTAFSRDAAGAGVAINNGTHKIVVVGQEFTEGTVSGMLAARYLGA